MDQPKSATSEYIPLNPACDLPGLPPTDRDFVVSGWVDRLPTIRLEDATTPPRWVYYFAEHDCP